MIIGKTETEVGTVYGKVHFLDLALSYISVLRNINPMGQRHVTLYPIKGYPFYKNYEFLLSRPDQTVFIFKNKKLKIGA